MRRNNNMKYTMYVKKIVDGLTVIESTTSTISKLDASRWWKGEFMAGQIEDLPPDTIIELTIVAKEN